jgi:hypothetical protein
MMINELLSEKYRVQISLDQAVNHSITKYVEETHVRVKKLSKIFGLNFKYSKPDKVLYR